MPWQTTRTKLRLLPSLEVTCQRRNLRASPPRKQYMFIMVFQDDVNWKQVLKNNLCILEGAGEIVKKFAKDLPDLFTEQLGQFQGDVNAPFPQLTNTEGDGFTPARIKLPSCSFPSLVTDQHVKSLMLSMDVPMLCC